MATSYRQDMPPKSGYPEFNWNRTLPKVLWKPAYVIGALAFATTYGLMQCVARKKRMITEKFEDIDLHSAMEPFLKAERDRYWLKLLRKCRDLENEVMKDVPGWKTGTWYGEPVYFTLGDKWWDPNLIELHAHSTDQALKNERMWRHHSEYSAPKFYDKYIPEFLSEYLW